MILENFVTNSVALNSLRTALSNLAQINFFAVMLDVSTKARPKTSNSSSSVEEAALAAAYSQGFVACLENIFYFHTLHVPKEETNLRDPDFGAADTLLYKGAITKEEYEHLTGKSPGNTTTNL